MERGVGGRGGSNVLFASGRGAHRGGGPLRACGVQGCRRGGTPVPLRAHLSLAPRSLGHNVCHAGTGCPLG